MTVTSIEFADRHTLIELQRELAARGVTMVVARRYTQTFEWLRNRGLEKAGPPWPHFPTLREAIRAFRREPARKASHPSESTEARD